MARPGWSVRALQPLINHFEAFVAANSRPMNAEKLVGS